MLSKTAFPITGAFVFPGGAPWTPRALTLDYWFDASDASTITIATGVSAWANKGSIGGSATQGTGSLQPSYSATDLGKPGVRFDGSDDYLSIAGASFTAAEMFAVFQIDAWPGAGAAVYSYSAAGTSNHHPFIDGNVYDGFASTTRQGPIAVTFGLFASPTLMNITSTSSEWTLRLNGSVTSTTGTNTVGNAATLKLGQGASITLAGVIREFGVRGSAFTADERAALLTYCQRKWGTP